ncbi:hypothetical protein HYH03_001700 [Edaphochlamys debaryana]|uniref:AAA+ ATPase domain-containing protein n=1 Tax=Edaphochlamys debaryana TaxID=47281 RepID=A0A835YCE3_9CHLO|nr:hypothetical protein HYH03_001700 [Edaphochlamys debaryana]|eukprot:KAG2500118.1 hypothetical protein HYH03_001700 [Edaphochlamys debaryana]
MLLTGHNPVAELLPPPAAFEATESPALPRVPLDWTLRLRFGRGGRGLAAPLEQETLPESDTESNGAGVSGGDSGDAELDRFLQLLPPETRNAVCRCAMRRLAEADADGSDRSAPPPLLVDLWVDAGRDVRLAFSDGSKRTLQGVKVPMGRALEQLATHVQALAEASASEAGASYLGDEGAAGSRAGKGSWGDSLGTQSASVDEDGWQSEGPAPSSPPLFGLDNRCCPPGTLHRVSALRDPRSGRVIGLTYRVGRHLPGVAGPLADVLADLAGRGRAWRRGGTEARRGTPQSTTARHLAGSLLLLGRPGSGKTTLLRDIAAHLSDGLGLGGGGGRHEQRDRGRRRAPARLHRLRAASHGGPPPPPGGGMIEAVQNHGLQVIVVDEIANAAEVAAARTIAARGVMLVATAHGTGLRSLMANNELVPLVGGLQSLILDAKAEETNNGSKTRTERSGKPVFRSTVEVLGSGRLLLRPDVASSVDAILGSRPSTQQWQQEEEDDEDVVHAPGSLLLHRSSPVADKAGGSAGGAAEPLPPLEQLRWTEPDEGMSEEGEEEVVGGGSGPSRGRLRVRLLELGAEASEEEE